MGHPKVATRKDCIFCKAWRSVRHGFSSHDASSCTALLRSQEPYWSRRAPRPPPRENASSASARTAWSSPRGALSEWCRRHEDAAARTARYAAGSSPRLVLLGDSLLQRLGENASLAERLARGLGGGGGGGALVLAVGGDQTQHVLWRLQHGELSRGMAADPRLHFVLQVGTNNLGNVPRPGPAHSPAETAEGILAVTRYLLRHARGRVLLTAVLPRGDAPRPHLGRAWLCPPRCNSSALARSTFVAAIDEVNRQLAAAAASLGQQYKGRFMLVDCGAPFRNDLAPSAASRCDKCSDGAACAQTVTWRRSCVKEGAARLLERKRGVQEPSQYRWSPVRLDLMPDMVHPNAAGATALARCISDGLNRLASA
ncbi:hypothetical protein AB1Y20_019585 [Prymnesium parvum]|uniref:SGNH hydrolase-type esterase domain-containing protein n=1 Tax=Prymnesium parvum TaxID=97485 RepID=A0AB34JS68_PRYPA